MVGDLKTGTDILRRDHLLVRVSHAKWNGFSTAEMAPFLVGDGLRYLPHTQHQSLSQVQWAWMRSEKCPTSLDRGEEGS